MKHVKAQNWQYAKEASLPLSPRCIAEIHLAAGAAVEITVADLDGVLHSLGTYISREHAKHKFRLDGFNFLYLNAEEEFGYEIRLRTLAETEKLNDAAPPEPIPETNILQRIRQRAAQESGVLREQFLDNDTGLNSYEIPDEDPALFEEEIVGKLKVKNKRMAQRRKEDRNRSDGAGHDSDKPDSVHNAPTDQPAVQEQLPVDTPN